MFSVEPPEGKILEAFRKYLQSRSFFLLTENGRALPPLKRTFSDSEAEKISEKFSAGGGCSGIGRRHGTPMLYHFIITEIKNGSARVDYSILESIEDLPRMTEQLFFTASFFQKRKLQTLIFPCISDFTVKGFQILRDEDVLRISSDEE